MRVITRVQPATSASSRKGREGEFKLSLADVAKRVEADPKLPGRDRQEILSALRTIGRAMRRELAEASAHPLHIRTRLEGFTPAMIDVSPRRWANCLSLFRKALDVAGLAHELCRKRAPFLPEWVQKLSLFPEEPETARHRCKYRLTAFARFCSAAGIGPDEVDDDTLANYRTELEKTELAKRPQDTHRALCIAWNQAADAYPDWPQRRVTVPHYRAQYSLDWEEFPGSLREDAEKYLQYLAGDDVLTGCPQPLRPRSIKSRRDTLRAYLSAVVINGRDISTLRNLADAVQIGDFENALRFFLKRGPKPNNGTENKAYAGRIADAIIAMARYWLKVDDKHLACMKEFQARLREKNRPKGMGEKSRTRIRQFDDPKQVHALAMLPIELMVPLRKKLDEEPKSWKPTYREALRCQMAVVIEIAVRLVLRIGNLTNLEIGRHLTVTKNGVMQISIPQHEVKNSVEISRVLPPEAAELINLYIERFRPVLLKMPSDHLFPAPTGGAKQVGHLSQQISDCIRRETGLVMHAHLFRHFAAKTYLAANPGAYGVMRLTHGHKSVNTTTAFYCDGSETDAAHKHYDQHITRLRQNSRDGAVPAELKRT